MQDIDNKLRTMFYAVKTQQQKIMKQKNSAIQIVFYTRKLPTALLSLYNLQIQHLLHI